MNSMGDTIVSPDLVSAVRRKYSPQEISNKYVRSVLHRIATEQNSPLELVHKGEGSAPNVYKKLRRIER